MTVDVCLWNIQNYGQKSGKYDGRGKANALRNAFIVAFVVKHGIDVLMIMEVQKDGEAALQDLVTQLNAAHEDEDWAYSFCGSAIRDAQSDVVSSPANLKTRTGARSECYGVVWRSGRTSFRMIEGVAQIASGTGPGKVSPLNISQLGRPTGSNSKFEFGATGGFLRSAVYPYDTGKVDDYDLMKYWPKLGYPQTGNLEGLKPTWANSRRPAYVVLKLNNGSGSLCPVAAYHAPSKEVRAYWGALMGGLAREVYVVDGVDGSNKPTPKAKPVLVDYGFFGGDFNYEVIKGWPGAYGYFISQSNKNDLGGADQRTVPAPSAAPEDRRTTVQLMGGQFHKDPIDKPTADAYLRYEIDLGFHRKVDSIQARRVDLLNEVMMNSGSYDTPLSQTAAYMKYLQDNIKRGEQQLAATGPEQLTGKRRRDSD